jgi:hypothetical protein
MNANITNSKTYSFPPMQVNAINGSSPQNAAYNSFIDSQMLTAKLGSLAGGKHKRFKKKIRGGQSVPKISIPQASMLYNDVSVPSINGSNGLIAKLISTTNQNNANAVYDYYGRSADNNKVSGGSRKKLKKRNTKRKTSKKNKKTKKSRKNRK